MIMILLLIAICSAITYVTWKNSRRDAPFAATITGIFATIICVIMLVMSYVSYLDIRAMYDATINQYKGAVTVYADYADLDVKKATLTDFKHQGYQENMARAITSLRRQIVYYNETPVKKRILNKNIMFGWLIIGPDEDMKIINIVE